MAFAFRRLQQRNAQSETRWVAGLYVTSSYRRIEAALLGIGGRGAGAPVEIRHQLHYDLPKEIASRYREFQSGGKSGRCDLHQLSTCREELAEIEAETLTDLSVESQIPQEEMLAVGVHDPGFWSEKEEATDIRRYFSLSDASLLAERSGVNVIDAFPARDLACGGKGGPLLPLPAWILLKSPQRPRFLLDLGTTTRLTFLPPPFDKSARGGIRFFQICPGGALMDSVTSQLTDGRQAIDLGGRLSVQGRLIPELLEKWLGYSPRVDGVEEWNPLGLSVDSLWEAIFEEGNRGDLSAHDMLCTAAHFIADSVARTLTEIFPEEVKEGEIVVSGGGCQNGMLLRQLVSRFPAMEITNLTDYGIAAETFDAACLAMLTLLHLDQIPGNLSHLTGAEVVRTLGRVTYGSPQNMQRLVQSMAEAKPVMRPLRSAM
jgi:anhydro-N-acetylmuramic acid kinase